MGEGASTRAERARQKRRAVIYSPPPPTPTRSTSRKRTRRRTARKTGCKTGQRDWKNKGAERGRAYQNKTGRSRIPVRGKETPDERLYTKVWQWPGVQCVPNFMAAPSAPAYIGEPRQQQKKKKEKENQQRYPKRGNGPARSGGLMRTTRSSDIPRGMFLRSIINPVSRYTVESGQANRTG